MTSPASPKDFEDFVAESFRQTGCRVEKPTNPNQEAWDLIVVTPAGKRGVVQIKSRKSGALPHPIFGKLSMYLSGPAGCSFDFGVNVVNTSFSKTTLIVLENASPETEDKFVYGAVVQFPKMEIQWVHHSPLEVIPPAPPDIDPAPGAISVPAFRIAVFTEKGGVGKTSVAAHLAGALLHQGRDTVLVDCDAQKNLSKLLGDGVNVRDKRGNVSSLVIEWHDNFDEENYPNYYIIFDCAPHFETNDPKIFAQVTDTVVPIVLSPLSVLGNAQVIERTITSIRSVNPNMRFHIVINQYEQSRTAANFQNQLLDYIRFWLKRDNFLSDPRVRFYEPDDLSIRRSTIMLHWGLFLLRQGSEPRLAFDTKVNGAQNLLSDFLALADVVEEQMEAA
jgi:chromosome partitioning protein